MTTLAEVARILGGLAVLYPRYTLTEATITAYHRILEDLPVELLDAAAAHLGAESTFFPAAAELRKAAFALLEQAQAVPSAWDAWEEVMKSFGPCGRYRAPQWRHPLIGRAVDAIGGYVALCDSTNTPADRARFIQAYEALLRRAQDELRMLPRVRRLVQQIGQTHDVGGLLTAPPSALARELFNAKVRDEEPSPNLRLPIS